MVRYLNPSQFVIPVSIPWYIWFYTQDRPVSQTGYNTDIQVRYQTTDRVMSFISGYDIDIQVRLNYTSVQQKQVAHSHKRLKLSGVIQSYGVILSIASAAPEFADTLFTGTISKYSSFNLHTLTLFYTLIQDIFIHFTTTITISIHPAHYWYYKTEYFLHFLFFEFLQNIFLCRLI